MKAFVSVLIMALLGAVMPEVACGQYQYDGDGFYVRVSDAQFIQIGLTGDSLKFDQRGNRKIDVEMYEVGMLPEGYGYRYLDEIDDPDFYVNDAASEISTLEKKYAKRFIKCLRRMGKTALLRIDVVDAAKGGKARHKYLELPSEARAAIVSAYRAL